MYCDICSKADFEEMELFNLKIQIYDDDYNVIENEDEKEVPDDDQSLLAKVKKLRRRYTNFVEYNGARVIYEEYMSNLIEKYGGLRKFELAYHLHHIKEFIPNQPRLKMTKRNRFLEKYDVLVANKLRAPEDLRSRVNELFGELPADDADSIPAAKPQKAFDKKTRKKILESLDNIKKSKEVSSRDILQFLDNGFIASGIEELCKKTKDKDKDEQPTLTDYLDGKVVFEEDDAIDNEVVFSNGYATTRGQMEYERLIRNMDDAGWNTTKMVQDGDFGFNKRDAKRYTKLYKTSKKKKKKKKNKLINKMDDFLFNVGLSNGFDSYKELEDSMNDFSSYSIMGE